MQPSWVHHPRCLDTDYMVLLKARWEMLILAFSEKVAGMALSPGVSMLMPRTTGERKLSVPGYKCLHILKA
jgi:hypothetical protein